jgi:hypothetical protein
MAKQKKDGAESPQKFNVNELHTAAAKRIEQRKRDGSRDFKKHLSPEYDVNVKETHAQSMDHFKTVKDPKLQELAKKHLESALAAGAAKFDR